MRAVLQVSAGGVRSPKTDLAASHPRLHFVCIWGYYVGTIESYRG